MYGRRRRWNCENLKQEWLKVITAILLQRVKTKIPKTQLFKISVSGEEIPVTGKPIAESGRVRYVMSKFNSKHGDVRKYYPKPDVAVEVSFW